jgi:hypothetical protein
MRVTVGPATGEGRGEAGTGAARGVGSGDGTDPDPEGIGTSILSTWWSEGVVRVPATDDRSGPVSSSSSMGKSMGVTGDAERVAGRRGAGERRMWSGTSRSRSSIWIRPRKVSSAPVKRVTLPSMASIRRLVRVVSSATWSKVFTRSSSAASRLSCSVKSENYEKI